MSIEDDIVAEYLLKKTEHNNRTRISYTSSPEGWLARRIKEVTLAAEARGYDQGITSRVSHDESAQMLICSNCNGSGVQPGDMYSKCVTCVSTGLVPAPQALSTSTSSVSEADKKNKKDRNGRK